LRFNWKELTSSHKEYSKTPRTLAGSASAGIRETSKQSLYSTALKRSINFGKIYVILAVAISLFMAWELRIAAVAPLYPIILPTFISVGSVGGLMIFQSDKAKGVYEYLIAYGINTSSIFWSIVVASIGLVSIILVGSIAGAAAVMFAEGEAVFPFATIRLLLFFTIPLSYAAVIFMSMAGMVWSSLATRRPGINSPVGPAIFIGIAPSLIVFFVSARMGMTTDNLVYLAVGVSALLAALAGLMTVVSTRKMVRERFLSNA
jgi:hypothetical protein